MKGTRFVCLDVHASSIAADSEVRALGTIPNDSGAVRKLVRKLGGPELARHLTPSFVNYEYRV